MSHSATQNPSILAGHSNSSPTIAAPAQGNANLTPIVEDAPRSEDGKSSADTAHPAIIELQEADAPPIALLEDRFTASQISEMESSLEDYCSSSPKQRSILVRGIAEELIDKICQNKPSFSQSERVALLSHVKTWFSQKARLRGTTSKVNPAWSARKIFYKENRELVVAEQKRMYAAAVGTHVSTVEDTELPDIDVDLIDDEHPTQQSVKENGKAVQPFDFLQLAITAEFGKLSAAQQEEYAEKARKWRIEGPPVEEKRRSAEKHASHTIRNFQVKMYRQMGVRMWSFVSFTKPDGGHAIFIADANTELGAFKPFRKVVRGPLQKSGIFSAWGTYAEACDAHVTEDVPLPGRGSIVPMKSNGYGEPKLPPHWEVVPPGQQASKHYADLFKSYVTRALAVSRGVHVVDDLPTQENQAAWGAISQSNAQYIDAECLLGDEFRSIRNPSHLRACDTKAYLAHWDDRDQRGLIGLHFHSVPVKVSGEGRGRGRGEDEDDEDDEGEDEDGDEDEDEMINPSNTSHVGGANSPKKDSAVFKAVPRVPRRLLSEVSEEAAAKEKEYREQAKRNERKEKRAAQRRSNARSKDEKKAKGDAQELGKGKAKGNGKGKQQGGEQDDSGGNEKMKGKKKGKEREEVVDLVDVGRSGPSDSRRRTKAKRNIVRSDDEDNDGDPGTPITERRDDAGDGLAGVQSPIAVDDDLFLASGSPQPAAPGRTSPGFNAPPSSPGFDPAARSPISGPSGYRSPSGTPYPADGSSSIGLGTQKQQAPPPVLVPSPLKASQLSSHSHQPDPMASASSTDPPGFGHIHPRPLSQRPRYPDASSRPGFREGYRTSPGEDHTPFREGHYPPPGLYPPSSISSYQRYTPQNDGHSTMPHIPYREHRPHEGTPFYTGYPPHSHIHPSTQLPMPAMPPRSHHPYSLPPIPYDSTTQQHHHPTSYAHPSAPHLGPHAPYPFAHSSPHFMGHGYPSGASFATPTRRIAHSTSGHSGPSRDHPAHDTPTHGLSHAMHKVNLQPKVHQHRLSPNPSALDNTSANPVPASPADGGDDEVYPATPSRKGRSQTSNDTSEIVARQGVQRVKDLRKPVPSRRGNNRKENPLGRATDVSQGEPEITHPKEGPSAASPSTPGKRPRAVDEGGSGSGEQGSAAAHKARKTGSNTSPRKKSTEDKRMLEYGRRIMGGDSFKRSRRRTDKARGE